MGEGDEIVQVFRVVTRIIISTPRMSYQHTHTLLLLPACGSGYTLLDWAGLNPRSSHMLQTIEFRICDKQNI